MDEFKGDYLRDYQKEAIDIIKSNNNAVICLPTGTGKNVVIIHSFQKNKKYLILVPRIILMEQLKEEIIKHKPELKNTIQDIKSDGNWIYCQVGNYKKQENIMSNLMIRKLWEDFINNPKYKKYFQSNEEVWIENFNRVISYIDSNNKRPLTRDKDSDINYIGRWLSHQITNYSIQEQIMSNSIIRKLWEDFINNPKYKKYFQSNEDNWKEKFNSIIIYIDNNLKKPSFNDKNPDIKKLAKWISHQITNYSKQKEIMSNPIIRKLWEDFITSNKYKKYFIKPDESIESV